MTAPFFSIVVPTCGRPHRLRALLDCLTPEKQELGRSNFEIIVSDDAAESGVEGLVAAYPCVRVVAGPGRGPAANRNNGARHAAGEWLVFVDDDCLPADGWLHRLRGATPAVDVVEGSIVAPYKKDTIFHRYVENTTGNCFWSANLAIRRDCFESLGGFDADFGEAGGEDMEFAFRLKANGVRSRFCSAAVVVHPPHVVTWAQWLRFQWRIRWHVLYLLKTGQTLPCSASMWRVVPHAVGTRIMGLMRVTWRALRQRDHDRPRATILELLLQWALQPILLPHIVYWEFRFRRMLRMRASAA